MSVILDYTGKPIASVPHDSASTIIKELRRVRASYDAAAQTRDLSQWWVRADGLSADAANSSSVRALLRNRARYEFANNSYCCGMALTLACDLIGWGPSLRMQLPGKSNNDLNKFVSREFNRWARAIRLAAKLRTMKVSKTIDGEAFCQQVTNPSVRYPVKLDLRLTEADQITTPFLDVLNENTTDGIRFDRLGNPVEYHRLKAHPGSAFANFEYDRIPASQMIHWFREDRPGQRRGVPEITPSLMLYALLRRWTLAVVQNAEQCADFTLFLKSISAPNDIEEYGDPGAEFDIQNIERGMMTTLPDGYEPKQLEPTQPGSTYKDGKREILSEIARCLCLPYNIAACDSSNSNFASGRLDHLPYYRNVDTERDDFEIVCMDRILGWWMDEAVLVWPQLTVMRDILTDPSVSHVWDWPALEEGDIEKKSTSRAIDIESGMSSFPLEFAKDGRNWEDVFTEQAEALGITLKEYQALRLEILKARAKVLSERTNKGVDNATQTSAA